MYGHVRIKLIIRVVLSILNIIYKLRERNEETEGEREREK